MNRKNWSLLLVFALVFSFSPSARALDVSFQLSPFSVAPGGSAALGLSAGIERFVPEKALINYFSLSAMGGWKSGTTNWSFSTAYLFHVGTDLYAGGRVGIVSYSSSSTPDSGFGAVVLRSQSKDSSWFYEVDLGLTGVSYGVASVGLRI